MSTLIPYTIFRLPYVKAGYAPLVKVVAESSMSRSHLSVRALSAFERPCVCVLCACLCWPGHSYCDGDYCIQSVSAQASLIPSVEIWRSRSLGRGNRRTLSQTVRPSIAILFLSPSTKRDTNVPYVPDRYHHHIDLDISSLSLTLRSVTGMVLLQSLISSNKLLSL